MPSIAHVARGAGVATISGMEARAIVWRRAAASAPPETFFVGSVVFHYLGPAFAVLLFARVPPSGVAWVRIASAAAIYAAWRRPWRALAADDSGAIRTVVAM